jgi:hypothetical protein
MEQHIITEHTAHALTLLFVLRFPKGDQTPKLLPDASAFCSAVREILIWRRTVAEESGATLVKSGRNITV